MKPATMFVGTWAGGEDERLVTEIRNAGWTVLFQEPDQEQVEKWLPNENNPVKVPCPNRMVIVGKYRGQVYTLDAGDVATYRPGDSKLYCWNETGRLLDNWVEGRGDGYAFPTPDDLHEADTPAAGDFF